VKKVLNIVSSINGQASFSEKLAGVILENLQKAYPGCEVHTHDLSQKPYHHMSGVQFGAYNTPADKRTEEQQKALVHSDKATKELLESDIIVIGVPMYNFGIPSSLKAWIDHIARAGVTFSYSAEGVPTGLVTGKKVYLAIASGGVYSEGFMKAYDFTENYLRAVLGFLGMTDVTAFRIEGMFAPGAMDTAVSKALNAVNEFAF